MPKNVDDKTTSGTQDYAKLLTSESKKDLLLNKKKAQDKKKSNLELFKEELRQMQEEREVKLRNFFILIFFKLNFQYFSFFII